MPADSPGGYDSRWRQDRSPWDVLFGDGQWHPVQVRAWWNDRHGHQVVQIEWFADGATWGEAFIAEADKMRAFEDESGGLKLGYARRCDGHHELISLLKRSRVPVSQTSWSVNVTTPEIRVDVLPVPMVGTVPTGSRNPYLTYLGRLKSAETKRTMQGCLDRLALIMVPDLKGSGLEHPGEHIPWHLARYEHATALNGVITQKLELGKKGAEGGWSPSHANKHITAWRRVLAEAKNLKLMTAEDRDDACKIESIDVKRELTGRRVRNDEITLMLDACSADEKSIIGARDAAVIALLWTTGGRRAEAAGVRTEKYDTGDRSVTLIGKGGHERKVYVNRLAVPYIENWLAIVGTHSGPLLRPVGKGGRIAPRHLSITAVGQIVDKRRQQCGLLPLTTHDYRRTFISNLFDLGVDISTIQEIVGHASPVTTKRYDRRDGERRKAAVDLLNLDPEKKEEGA